MVNEFFEMVGDALGPDAYELSDDTRSRYGANRLPGGDRRPAGVLYPSSTEDVQHMVQLANRHGVSLWPTSTGQNIGIGGFSPVREGQVVLHLGARMDQILEVNEQLAYAVIQPGVTFRQLRAELARRGDTLMLSSTSGPPDGSILGNAMDRGAGYTPYFNHFAMLCGLEVVLPDGEVLYTGDGAFPGAKTRFLNSSGFGPSVEGMFSQSNFGVATQAAVWLMPRPPVIRSFAFTFPDDDDLGSIIDLCRPLKLNNQVPTLLKVSSGTYGFGTHVTYPFDRTQGVTPLPAAVRHEMEDEYGTGAWTVTGAFYGPTQDAVEPLIQRVRDHFGQSPKATYVPHEQVVESPVLKIHLDTFSGEPTDRELGLLDWRPGGGAIWLLPATPMIGSIALEHQELSRRILTDHGFEYIVEFVCGPRAARALHLVVYNREDPDERARMAACYQALMDGYDAIGYPVGRMPTDHQERAMARLPALDRFCGIVKEAVDPRGVIAPGKYGIA